MDIITTHTTADRKEINEFVNQVCVLAEQKFQTGMRIAKVNIHGDIVIRGATTSERALWLAQLLAQFAKKHGKDVQFSISDILVDENGYVTDSEGYAVDALKPQKQQQQQLQAVVPAAAKGAWYVAKRVSGSVFNHNAVYAIVHTAANEDACWEWRQRNDPYSSGNFKNVNDAIMAHGKKCANDTYLKPVYDKSAIMKRAWELRKQGLTTSNAMKQAWAEAKNGGKF